MTVKIVLLPNPYTLDWKGWIETVVGYNPGLMNEIDPDAPWLDCAHQFCRAVPEAPPPETFGVWQDWAAALKQALSV